MRVGKTLTQIVLSAAFLGSGGAKLAGVERLQDEFTRYRYPQWTRVATGLVEVTAASGMLLGFFKPVLARMASLLLLTTMLGAVITHLRIKDPLRAILLPFLFGVLATLHFRLNRRRA